MITNEISKKYINDKVAELKNNTISGAIKNIDAFLEKGLKEVTDELINILKEEKIKLLTEIEKTLASRNHEIENLKTKIKDYEEDLNTIEKLKAFKRKSKFLT